MKLVPTPELGLLLLCARMRINPDVAQRISLILRRTLDWNGLVLLARRHGLSPLLYRTLSGLRLNKVPTEILEKLRSSSEVIRFRALVMARELLRALQALEAAGVTATPYKGPALAACLYGDFTLRQLADLDLLVKSRDALKARRVLLEHGFISKRQIPDRALAAYVRFHGEFSFTGLKGQVLIILNWRITPWYWRLPEIPDTTLGRLSTYIPIEV